MSRDGLAGPTPDEEIYDEFGDRDFGGTYFTVLRDGKFIRFEKSPHGLIEQISEGDYAQAAQAWIDWVDQKRRAR